MYLCRLFIFKKGSMQKNEIILYHPEGNIAIEVRLEDKMVWLSRQQMARLFDRDVKTIGKHINNALKEELKGIPTVANFATVQLEGNRSITRMIEYYGIDMVLSVGYRVKSRRGVDFRRWANAVLQDYILRGYAVNQRIERLEERVSEHDRQIKFFVRAALPPTQGVFYDGQIFDAYVFAAELIKTAKESIVLIDNYIDESVLLLLSKRKADVSARILTRHISQVLATDLSRHNQQYPPITIEESPRYHDRFLIIDGTVYHIGASLKDLGKKLFAFSKMEVSPEWIGV